MINNKVLNLSILKWRDKSRVNYKDNKLQGAVKFYKETDEINKNEKIKKVK